MSNSIRGEVTIESGGQLYPLVMDTNAMVEVEDVFSTPEKPVSFTDVLANMERGRMKYIRAFVWAALRRHHEHITLKETGRFIDGAGGIVAFSDQLRRIVRATQPDKDDTATAGETSEDGRPTEAPAAERKRGHGARSIDSPVTSA